MILRPLASCGRLGGTNPGDASFEPFAGSGSQIIAVEQLGCRCYACEIEPAFVDVAVRRWEALTNLAAH